MDYNVHDMILEYWNILDTVKYIQFMYNLTKHILSLCLCAAVYPHLSLMFLSHTTCVDRGKRHIMSKRLCCVTNVELYSMIVILFEHFRGISFFFCLLFL